MLTDTHAHLYWEDYKQDLDEVIKRSVGAGVTTIINVGVDVEKSKEALVQVLNKDWPDNLQVYSTIGIHPHEAVKFSFKNNESRIELEDEIKKLEEIYHENPNKVIAVGECGLDYFFDPEFTPSTLSHDQIKNLQRQLFQAQIDLAKKINLPLIVHCRDDRSKNPNITEAWDEVLDLVDDYPTILHCYSGLSQTTNYILQTTNLIVSFAGTITYPKNEYLREAAKLLPLGKIVLETDCPFLPPQSERGQRNEPANVLGIAQLIADLKEVPLEEVASQTTANSKGILRLPSE